MKIYPNIRTSFTFVCNHATLGGDRAGRLRPNVIGADRRPTDSGMVRGRSRRQHPRPPGHRDGGGPGLRRAAVVGAPRCSVRGRERPAVAVAPRRGGGKGGGGRSTGRGQRGGGACLGAPRAGRGPTRRGGKFYRRGGGTAHAAAPGRLKEVLVGTGTELMQPDERAGSVGDLYAVRGRDAAWSWGSTSPYEVPVQGRRDPQALGHSESWRGDRGRGAADSLRGTELRSPGHRPHQ